MKRSIKLSDNHFGDAGKDFYRFTISSDASHIEIENTYYIDEGKTRLVKHKYYGSINKKDAIRLMKFLRDAFPDTS